VVTGIGAVTAFGWSVNDLRQGLLRSETAIRPARHLDTACQRTDIAGEVGRPPDRVRERVAEWSMLARADRFAVTAGEEACGWAALDPGSVRAGLFFGSSTAGMRECEDYVARMLHLSQGHPRLRLLASQQVNGPGDAVARHLGVKGPVETLSAACASGVLAIVSALDAIRSGEVDVAVAGGADALCRLTYSGFNSLRLVDPNPCVPFRADRQGMNLGEGAALMVLENLEHARARGARPLAELLGAGTTCDAHHMTAPHPEGEGSARAMRAALRDAGVSPGDITFVNAHGTGTSQNDLSETRALREVFGDRTTSIPVTATKGSIGHLLGSAGAVEAVDVVLCFLDRHVHATPGEGPVDEACGIDLVFGEPRPLAAGSIAISTSFAFGGANGALVLADRTSGSPS
jgi:3-oxoacyl-[acyl-carrier-protein] synthase II